MRSNILRVAAVAVALSGLTAAASTSHALFLVPAFIALFFLATSFSEAGRLIQPLQEFLHRSAEVHVWGTPLPVPGGATITITSVKALSAGLHVFLQVGPNGPSTHLKVAQPGRAQVLPQQLTIESAAYVQWAGKRLPRVAGAPALTISLHSPPLSDSHRG
jgi:hypothetical protein